MKKLFIVFTILCFVVPAMADTLTFNYTVSSGTPDHLVFHHALWTGENAQEFIDSAEFTDLTVPAVSPTEVTFDYDQGVQYGVYVDVVDEMGNINRVSDYLDGNLSPTVWRFTGQPSIVDAHVIDVAPTAGNVSIIINVTQGN